MTISPQHIPAQTCKTAQEAFEYLKMVYEAQTEFLREQFQNFCKGQEMNGNVRGFYPYAKISTLYALRADTRMSYGFAPRPGTYSTTLTRPDIYEAYYLEQFRQIIRNHDITIEIGVSEVPIPIHFALGEGFHLEGELSENQLKDLPDIFDVPNLDIMDDEIANAVYVLPEGQDGPLSLFTAPPRRY